MMTVLFFLSGLTGLIYEVVWAHYLGLALGNTGVAHVVVLATYMGGLALGNLVFGRLADRVTRPLVLYGALEVAVGVFAVCSPALLVGLSQVYLAAASATHLPVWAQPGLKMTLAAAALIVPTMLMGGALPALGRAFATSLDDFTHQVSRLYFFNSAGAVFGALLPEFWLIPAWGLDGALWLAAGVSVALGAVALALSARAGRSPEAPPAAPALFTARQRRIILACALVSGFIAMTYEIAWIRLLSLVLGSSTYSFALMLAAFIAGIALGSAWVHRGRLPGKDAFVQFGLAQAAIALAIAVTIPFYGWLPYALVSLSHLVAPSSSAFLLLEGLKFLLCFALMLLPTTFIGMSLPLASRVVARSADEIGSAVGLAFGLNTLGNVAGAVVAGLWLLPWLGVQGLIEAGAFGNVAIALAIALSVPAWRPAWRAASALPLAALATYHAAMPAWDWALLTGGAFRDHGRTAGLSYEDFRRVYGEEPLLFHRDDVGQTVTVSGDSRSMRLRVNGKVDATSDGDLPTQILVGQLPMLLAPRSDEVLLVGLGSGITAGSVLSHPVKRLDVSEISPAVTEAARLFAPFNRDALSDPRLRMHDEDALGLLRLDGPRYDVIVNEPSNPWIAGVGNLYTLDFYRAALARLHPQGVFVQWFQTYEMDDATLKVILRTFLSAFPHATLWQGTEHDILLVGSRQAPALDFKAMEERFSRPAVKADLARIGIEGLPELLSTQMASDRRVRKLVGAGDINTLTHPRLAYMAPVAFFVGKGAQLPHLEDQRRRLPRGSVKELELLRYLEARGRDLSRRELERMFRYQLDVVEQRPVAMLYLREWMARFPDDRQARYRFIDMLRREGRIERAYELARALAEESPDNADFVALAATLEVDDMLGTTSYLAPSTARMHHLEATMARVRQLRPELTNWTKFKLARVYLAASEFDRAYDALQRVELELAGAPLTREVSFEMRNLWLSAAQVAYDADRYGMAASCLRRALALMPDDPVAANFMREVADKLRREPA